METNGWLQALLELQNYCVVLVSWFRFIMVFFSLYGNMNSAWAPWVSVWWVVGSALLERVDRGVDLE